MTCEDFLRRLDEGDDAPELDAHRASCGSCESAHAESLRLDDAIRSLPLPEPDWAAYDERLRGKIKPVRRFWIAWTAAAAAMVAATLYSMIPVTTTPTPTVAASPKASPVQPSPLTRFTLAFQAYRAGDRARLEPELLSLARGVAGHVALLAGSTDHREAAAALDLLVKLRLPESIPGLKERLDGEGWRNEAVLAAIARMDLPGSAPAVAEAIARPEYRSAAAAACALLPSHSGVAILVAAYGDLKEGDRAAADKVIAANPRPARLAVAAALTGPRAEALLPLAAKLGLKEAAPGLIRVLNARPEDSDAAAALALIADASALRSLLGGPSAAAFARAEGEAGAEELRRLALDRDPKVARAAVALLPGFDGPKTRRTLAAAAGRTATRREAVTAMVAVNDVATLSALLDASPALAAGETAVELGNAKSRELRPALLRAALNPATSLQSAQALLDEYPAVEIAPALIPALGDYRSRSRAGALLNRLTGETLPPDSAAWTAWLKHTKETPR